MNRDAESAPVITMQTAKDILDQLWAGVFAGAHDSALYDELIRNGWPKHGGPDAAEPPETDAEFMASVAPFLPPIAVSARPRIVCLCGSTRFVPEFNRQRAALTVAGEIVLSIEVVTTQAREDDPQHADPALKARLDELHKRKIDLADYVLVLNVDGYIGESTRGEIEYAEEHGKPVRFLESADSDEDDEPWPDPDPDGFDPGPEVDDEGGMSEYRHALPDGSPDAF